MTTDTHLIHGHITHAILSAASRVHSRLGPGLLERPYRECLCLELTRRELRVEIEKQLPVEYDQFLPIHDAQLMSYLKLSQKRVGLLLNFNVISLRDGIRRRVIG